MPKAYKAAVLEHLDIENKLCNKLSPKARPSYSVSCQKLWVTLGLSLQDHPFPLKNGKTLLSGLQGNKYYVSFHSKNPFKETYTY
jgi:hypothetical protein